MANKPAGDGGGGIDWVQFFQSEDRVFLDFGRIAEVGFFTVIGAIFTGFTSLVVGLADIPVALLGGFGDFLGTLVGVLTEVPALLIRGAWFEAITFVAGAGPAGFVVAIVFVAVTFYIVAWGVSKIGG